MNHISEEILIEFADGLLNPEVQKEVEVHLTECSACREEVEMFRSLSVLLEKENLLKAPPATTNLVMQQVELHQHIMMRKAKSRRTAFGFAGIMAGFFGLMLGLGFILNPGNGDPFKLPAYIINTIKYMTSLEFSIKNPVFLYVAVSLFILLIIERIIRTVKPGKVNV